jgi:hypothetical protein
VTPPETTFREAGAELRIQSVPLAHLSIELGHLYFEDFAGGPDALRHYFRRVAPWARAARAVAIEGLAGRTPRISTCFLIDDYFGPSSSPAAILPALLRAAEENGLAIDYLARESACAEADGVALAKLVEERIVAEPPPDTNGSRPPVSEVGWLSNGQRSPVAHAGEAMGLATPWRPPVQTTANRHSVFVDVELWNEPRGGRVWSCAFLASVWQLVRLGMLRHQGQPVAMPQEWDGAFPSDWNRLPAVLKLNPKAAPFNAYRALSILDNRFLTTEHAVRTVLSQVSVDPRIIAQVVERGRGEKLVLPSEPVDRISYVFQA